MRHWKTWVVTTALAFTASAAVAQADDYPNRPIRWIVPYAAGGLTDKLARDYADKLQRALGQPVVVENRTGGNGLVGTVEALVAPADGYTLYTFTPVVVTSHSLYPDSKWPEDPLAVFAPVSMFIKFTNVLVASSKGVQSIQSLIATNKGGTRSVLFGTPGIGAAHHLAALQFGALTGVKMSSVPYKGSGPLIVDLLGGHVDLGSDNLANWIEHDRAGRAKVLVVLGPERSKQMPNVPSMADLGYPGFEGAGWQGLAVRVGTPQPIIDRLAREIQRITALPEFKRYETSGDVLVGGSPQQFRDFIRTETVNSREAIRSHGIKAD